MQSLTQNSKNLQQEEWYQLLVDECKAILTERFYNSNLEAVVAYGEVGERIVEDPNYQKFGKGNRKFNLRMFKDIKIGERTGYYCLQFYETKLREPVKSGKYKDVCTAVQTIYPKNLTWNSVRAELPEGDNKEDPITEEEKATFKKQVLQGDCVEEMKKLPDKSIDMIYVDPPYGVNKDTWDTFKEGEFLPFTLSWIKECLRLLKNKSHFFIHFPSEKSAWLENLILEELSMLPVSRIVWANRSLPMGRDASDRFLSTYQPILHYNLGSKPLNFTPEWTDERFDVWTIAIPQTNYKDKKLHITQKPLELMDRLIRYGSFTGAIVLAPTAGSGTTGVASLNNDRDFILIEREPKYVDIIHRRLNDISK